MPRVTSDAEEMAQRLGEAIADDVQCWETSGSNGARTGVLMLTHEGFDYVVTVRKLARPHHYEPEPDE